LFGDVEKCRDCVVTEVGKVILGGLPWIFLRRCLPIHIKVQRKHGSPEFDDTRTVSSQKCIDVGVQKYTVAGVRNGESTTV
jgi:hypothetical protein